MIDKIKYHHANKEYVKLYREVAENVTETSSGYILAFSENFLLLQESDDFRALGYNVFPINQIIKLRFNRSDKYYDKIIKAEKEIDNFKIDYAIDLDNWLAIFKSIKNKNLNVIVECEGSEDTAFTIGSIIDVNDTNVCIKYFDATGLFDKELTCIDYESITKVMFDDRYINILSKYTRYRKA